MGRRIGCATGSGVELKSAGRALELLCLPEWIAEKNHVHRPVRCLIWTFNRHDFSSTLYGV